MSQSVLAHGLGVARGTIDRLECGQRVNPRLSLLTSIARSLQVDTGVLVCAYLGLDPCEDKIRSSHATDGATQPPPGSIGSRGMGVALRAFRTDFGAGLRETASRAGTHRGYLLRFEAGLIASPGLLSVTRLATAVDAHDVQFCRSRHRIELLLAVYAGDLTAYEAIKAHRRSGLDLPET